MTLTGGYTLNDRQAAHEAQTLVGAILNAYVPTGNREYVTVSKLYADAASLAVLAPDAVRSYRDAVDVVVAEGTAEPEAVDRLRVNAKRIQVNYPRFYHGWNSTPDGWPTGWPASLWQPSAHASVNLHVGSELMRAEMERIQSLAVV